LLVVLLVHPFLHLTEPSLYLTAGPVHRNDQLKDKLVQEPGKYGEQNIFHSVKISTAYFMPPALTGHLPTPLFALPEATNRHLFPVIPGEAE
jgi:hypothetical protein